MKNHAQYEVLESIREEARIQDTADELFEEEPAPAKCAFPSGCGDIPWTRSRFCYVHTDKLDFALSVRLLAEDLRLERENVREQAAIIAFHQTEINAYAESRNVLLKKLHQLEISNPWNKLGVYLLGTVAALLAAGVIMQWK